MDLSEEKTHAFSGVFWDPVLTAEGREHLGPCHWLLEGSGAKVLGRTARKENA